MFNKAFDLEKESHEFNGFYRAVVEDVEDELQAGRVRARVYPMFANADVDALPWAIPADPSFGGKQNVGQSLVPSLGSMVFVFFENGDHRFPVYFAGAPAMTDGEPDAPKLAREDDGTVQAINSNTKSGVSTPTGSWSEPQSAYAAQYPNNKVFRSDSGIIVEIDDTPDNVRIHFYHPSGTRMEIDNDGNMVEHIEATKYSVMMEDGNVYVGGDHNVTADGDWGVKVGGDGKIKIGSNFNLEVGANCTIKSNGNCTIQISGSGNVKASGALIVKGQPILLN